ncbi:polysaccharide lyase family 8 super-sandwich domain-containing protein [Paenibacillus xanthanilyticus]|uniref:Polysaccharide lyase family 8 super-sandwich domain-containing protein n=1 Tax=Paenibacillus xanthanilyticus TaxID=1783531 RepID=A0ABV8JY47_9BACL
MLTFVLMLGGTIGSFVPSAHAADEYDGLRAKWKTLLVGGANANASDPDIAASIQSTTTKANGFWTSLDTSAGRTALWSDLADWSASSTITGSYNRLKTMAIAYATSGSSLQQNATLKSDIIAALDWLYANKYNTTKSETGNWWDWEIGTPLILNDIMTLLYDDLSAAQRTNYLNAIQKFCPDPTKRTISPTITETGANRLDKALIVAVAGVVGKDSAKLTAGRNAISQTLLYVTDGDGFYTDGSFVQHADVAYTGSYGSVLISDMAKLLYLLQGSTWQVTDANLGNVYKWVTDSFQPVMYKGAIMDMVRGRAISREESEDHEAGRSIIISLVRLAEGAPADKALLIRQIAKGWIAQDTTFANYYAEMGVSDIVRVKALMSDSAVAAGADLVKTHVFAGMDRAVQLRPTFALGLSLFSSRISAFEYINGENGKGWYTGAGMTSLYNGDLSQFSGNYWATVDMYRLPGTTTDGAVSATPVNSKHYTGNRNWVGGSELGSHASVGMDFSMTPVTGTTLAGKKSWFLFGDRIVALGSGITSTDNKKVETIIENRKLNAAGTNALTVNGSAKSTASGWNEAMTNVSWAHLAGSAAGSDIGYYFPSPSAVSGLRETRTGSWSQVNTGQSTAQVTNRFLSLAFNHGNNPSGATYAYAILPGKSASDMAAYAANPDIAVLENSTAAHAVRDSASGTVGANFWNDAVKTVNVNGSAYLTSNKKSSVTVTESGGELAIAAADPTQANTGTIRIEINRTATSALSLDAGVTVVSLAPTIQLDVNVAGSLGRSFAAKFALGSAVVTNLGAEADAYVRDGASASVNYGADTSLVIKNDVAGYAREAFIRFNLAGVSSPVASAKLRLTPTSVGMTGIAHQAYLAASDSWGESSITWSNKPASGALLGSWTVPAAGTSAMIDITAEVNAAIAGDKKVSIRIAGASNQGANGWANYGSKEHATADSRPALVLVQ